MRSFLALSVGAAVCATAAAAQTPVITVAPAAGQMVFSYQGKPALKSDGRISAAVLILTTPRIAQGGGPVFIAGVKSASAQPVAFRFGDVRVTTDAGPGQVLTRAQVRAATAALLAREGRTPPSLAGAGAVGFRPLTLTRGETRFTPLALGPLPAGATRLNLALTINGEAHRFAYSLVR